MILVLSPDLSVFDLFFSFFRSMTCRLICESCLFFLWELLVSSWGEDYVYRSCSFQMMLLHAQRHPCQQCYTTLVFAGATMVTCQMCSFGSSLVCSYLVKIRLIWSSRYLLSFFCQTLYLFLKLLGNMTHIYIYISRMRVRQCLGWSERHQPPCTFLVLYLLND